MDTILQRFMAYAGDFERAYIDDDWTRVQPYFAPDAVYEVNGAFGCRLTGPAAICAGMKKSLDSFDRTFAKREIEVTSGPEVSANELQMGWTVVYTMDGHPPFVLRGRSTARYADGMIVHLADSYGADVESDFAAWQRATGVTLNPSYT